MVQRCFVIDSSAITLIRHCGPDGAHEDISCEEGQIVIVNYAATEDTWLWQCGDDDGRCPGAFQVGCEPDDSYTTTTIDPVPIHCSYCDTDKTTHRKFIGEKH